MATRYHRVNQDGDSLGYPKNGDTKTAKLSAAGAAGRVVKLNSSGLFVAPAITDPGTVQLFAVERQTLTGLKIDAVIAAGESVIGNYAQTGRLFAMNAVAGAYVEGAPVYLNATGQVTATKGTDATIFGYAKETVTLTAADFVLIQVA